MFIRLTLVMMIAGLSACATVEGAGEDIQAAGAAVSTAAEETADEI